MKMMMVLKDQFKGNLQNGLREETMGIDFRHYYKNLGPSYKARNMG